jgi:hypothetical protein
MTHKKQDSSRSLTGEKTSLDARLAAYAAVSLSIIATGAAQATPQYTQINAPMTTLTPSGEAFINYGGGNAFLGMMTSLNRISGDASLTFSGMVPGTDAVTVVASPTGGATSTLDFLSKGTEVGGTGNNFVFATGGYTSTNVVKAGNHEVLYTGLRATSANGKDFYGWAAFSFNTTTEQTTNLVDFNSKILGYAFETSANTPIAVGDTGGAALVTGSANPVPEPASLLLMAAGATGLLAWRKRRES